jgi:hypothetical protein
MIVLKVGGDGADVRLSSDELRILNNALNEICNGSTAPEGWEFQTLIGVERSEALSLLKTFAALFRNLN